MTMLRFTRCDKIGSKRFCTLQHPGQVDPGTVILPVLLVLVMSGFAPASAGTPKAVVEKTEHNFGQHETGPVLEHTFEIKNAGDAPLKILAIRPQCGCTEVGDTPDVIAPRETGLFPFSLRTHKVHRRYAKNVRITTNDPDNPQIVFKLCGVSRERIEVGPARAYFGRIMRSEVRTKVLRITNHAAEPLELTLPAPNSRSPFTYELSELEQGRAFELRVTNKPLDEPGAVSETLTLQTNWETEPLLRIMVRGEVPPRLELLPECLHLFEPAAGAQAVAQADEVYAVRFLNHGAKPVRVLEAGASDPALKIELREQAPGHRYALDLTVPSSYRIPSGGASLTLKTDDAAQPKLSIPLYPKVRPKPRGPRAQQLRQLPVPRFEVTTEAGKPISSAELRGRVTVLNFFAADCPYSRRQLPEVEKLRRDFAELGVRFVNVCQTMRKRVEPDLVKQVLRDLGAESELVLDPDNQLSERFQLERFPTFFIVGKGGKVQSVRVGFQPKTFERRVRRELARVLAGEREL